jgi:hypothetical protein
METQNEKDIISQALEVKGILTIVQVLELQHLIEAGILNSRSAWNESTREVRAISSSSFLTKLSSVIFLMAKQYESFVEIWKPWYLSIWHQMVDYF